MILIIVFTFLYMYIIQLPYELPVSGHNAIGTDVKILEVAQSIDYLYRISNSEKIFPIYKELTSLNALQ